MSCIDPPRAQKQPLSCLHIHSNFTRVNINARPKLKLQLHINAQGFHVSVSHPLLLSLLLCQSQSSGTQWGSERPLPPPSLPACSPEPAPVIKLPLKGHELTANRWVPYWNDRGKKKVVISTQAYHLQNILNGHKLFSDLPKIVRSSWTAAKRWMMMPNTDNNSFEVGMKWYQMEMV